MDYLTLGLLNGFIVPLILGSSSSEKSGFLIVPKSSDGFSTISNIESTKLNPNGATVRQWETRTWITTIPLHKIVNLKPDPLEAFTRLPVTKLKSKSSSSSSSKPLIIPPSVDDHYLPVLTDSIIDPFLVKPFYRTFNLTVPPSIVKSEESSEDGQMDSPRGKRILSLSPPSFSSSSSPADSNGSCFGDSCRRKPFQGTYDTINYSKELISPEIKSLPRYPDEPGYSKTSPYRHSSSSSSADDHNDSDHHDEGGGGSNDDEDDKPKSRSKANISWTRLHPTETHSSPFQEGDRTRYYYPPGDRSTESGVSGSDKERRGRSRESDQSTVTPKLYPHPTDSFEYNEDSKSNRPKTSPGRGKLFRPRGYRYSDDYHPGYYHNKGSSSSKSHREDSENDNQGKKVFHHHHRSTDYSNDDTDGKWRSSEDQSGDRIGEKSILTKDRTGINEKNFKEKFEKKFYPRTYHYHHDHTHHSGEDTHEGEGHSGGPNEKAEGNRGSDLNFNHAGYDKDDKGYFFEPSNLSGHFSSSEVTEKSIRENTRLYKTKPLKSSRKMSECHCLKSNSNSKLKYLTDNSSEDKRKAAR